MAGRWIETRRKTFTKPRTVVSIVLVLVALATVWMDVSAKSQSAATAAAAGVRTSGLEAVTPFTIHVPDETLADLKKRLARARLPREVDGADWKYGTSRAYLEQLIGYWRDQFDWRAQERRLNQFEQFTTNIDGLNIHFIWRRSKERNAFPLLITHGWPGSFVEFPKIIGPLTDPAGHGGHAADAFDVVIPSIPGFGFSDKPTETGWNAVRIAKAWSVLMNRLGYRRYLAQGGDWGGGITTQLGKLKPEGLAGVHLNFPEYLFAPPLAGDPTPAERAALAQVNEFFTNGSGYHREQSTRPQTIGYALSDSPSGQAAWIYEKFGAWTDSSRNPEAVLGINRILDAISLYWLTDTAASSARLYWEGFSAQPAPLTVLDLPVGISVFPKEIVRTPRIWAERAYRDLVYFNDRIPAGGHFAAFEQPQLFAEELRAFARKVR
jgi:pimeloyl-ACP methyl ester carboxylesterase